VLDDCGENETLLPGGAGLGEALSRSERSIIGIMLGSRRTETVMLAGDTYVRRRLGGEEVAFGGWAT
jgi:hypothetical protein